MRTATAIIAFALAGVLARRRDTPLTARSPVTALAVSWPTLRNLDEARSNRAPTGAEYAFTEVLERRARALTDEFWSDLVWVTGSIAPEPLETVIDALDREREESILDPRRFRGRLPDC